jgi:GR25 family glycosyltransferase involved in LPS biosynthesis
MIDTLFIINLKRRADKLQDVLKPIEKLEINKEKYKICPAIDCKDFTSVKEMVKKYQNIHFNPTIFKKEDICNTERYRAKFGCWLSHYTLLKQYKDATTDDWIIIMEDDCHIQYNLHELNKQLQITAKIHNSPDMIILSDRIGICGKHINNNLNAFKEKVGNFGTDCYAVKKSSCKKIVKNLRLNREQNYCSIDNCYADMNKHDIIKIVPLIFKSFGICCDRGSKNSDIEV